MRGRKRGMWCGGEEEGVGVVAIKVAYIKGEITVIELQRTMVYQPF